MNLNKLTEKEKALEFYKCKQNPFYYIYNYVYIPESGGQVLYSVDKMHSKMKQTVRSVMKFHRVVLMATRQLGKTTLAAALIEWANNFYPNMRSIILTYSKAAAQEALDRIKFIHSNNPSFLSMKLKGHGDKKTYLEYSHGSKINTFFTSGSTDPSKIGRAFTSPILYIDEAAHIRGIEEAYGSAQPILSTAKQQAIKNNYPHFILVTSTPNGTVG